MAKFELVSDFKPTGDQPQAIAAIAKKKATTEDAIALVERSWKPRVE